MAKQKNTIVERLHSYLPLDPANLQIYEEFSRSEDAISLPTAALTYIENCASANKARLLILTGDAGHGKTHLCRRLLESYLGYSEAESREALTKTCDGNKLLKSGGEDKQALRIYKDFSETNIDIAAKNLERSGDDSNELTIICVNEGRLRSILKSEHAGDVCEQVGLCFEKSFKTGLVSQDEKLHLVNLNYQSVASPDNSLVRSALKQWLDGRRWNNHCGNCSSREKCPILHNRELLAAEDKSATRVNRLVAIFEAAERLGAVITIRDMLMVLAYMITGGIRCEDVQRKKGRGWQRQHAFYNILFEPPDTIQADQLKQIPLLQQLSAADPGMRGFREIDEVLVNKGGIFPEEEIDLQFKPTDGNTIDAANGIDEIIGSPSSHKERKQEAAFTKCVVRSLRRRYFFDVDEMEKSKLSTLGFRFGDKFQAIIDGDLSNAEMLKLKNRIIAGLHVLQGLHLKEQPSSLYLVDPAFGEATSTSAIIACKIASKDIKVMPMRNSWNIDEESESLAIFNAVDWLDRALILRIKQGGKSFEIELDLLLFDTLAGAADGYISEAFYDHDIRKMLNFLARIAERGESDDGRIQLFVDGIERSISIDNNVIQISG